MSEIISYLLGAGGLASIIYGVVALMRTIFNRKIVNATAANKHATAADRLTDSAIEMIQEVRRDASAAIIQARTDAATSVAVALQDVAAARRDTDEARRDAAEARREATAARKEAVDANLFMRRLIAELFRPDASIDRLRRLVNDGGSGETISMNGIHR